MPGFHSFVGEKGAVDVDVDVYVMSLPMILRDGFQS